MTVFLIVVNNHDRLPQTARLSQLAYDASLHKTSSNLSYAWMCIEIGLRSIQQRRDVNGFTLSPETAQEMVFTRRHIPNDFNLLRKNVRLSLKLKFLGLFLMQGYFGITMSIIVLIAVKKVYV